MCHFWHKSGNAAPGSCILVEKICNVKKNEVIMCKPKKYMLLLVVITFICVANSMAFGQCLYKKSIGQGQGWSSTYNACTIDGVKGWCSFTADTDPNSYVQRLSAILDEDGTEHTRHFDRAYYSAGYHYVVWDITGVTTENNHRIKLDEVPYQAPTYGFISGIFSASYYNDTPD
jgi:hypothetical protein